MAKRGKQPTAKQRAPKRRLNLGQAPPELLIFVQRGPELARSLKEKEQAAARWWASLPQVTDDDRRLFDCHEHERDIRRAGMIAAEIIAQAKQAYGTDPEPEPRSKAKPRPTRRRRISPQWQVTLKILATAFPNVDDYRLGDILKTIKTKAIWEAACELLKIPQPWPEPPKRDAVARHLGRRR